MSLIQSILQQLSQALIPQAYAACSPGSGNINLGDCLTLGYGSSQTVAEVYSSPAVLVNVIVGNAFVLAGLIFFLMVVYSGFQFIQNGKQGMQNAQKTMQTAVIGLIVMFVAYWIIQIIEVITGLENIV